MATKTIMTNENDDREHDTENDHEKKYIRYHSAVRSALLASKHRPPRLRRKNYLKMVGHYPQQYYYMTGHNN